MRTLQYYSAKGKLTTFPDYLIDENSNVKNVKIDKSLVINKSGKYNTIVIRHKGKQRNILVGRALASTFIGPPPTLGHTADHIDRNSKNDVLENIRWANKKDQARNRTMPTDFKSAFIIENGGIENTAKGWAEVYKKPNGKNYAAKTITEFAQQKKHGFHYKTFKNLRGEVWKPVEGSKNKNGEWFISSKSRMKYKTAHAENVLTVDTICKNGGGYPMITINGKHWLCHELSMMTFRPNEYAARMPGDMILHKNDNKLDFNPFRLRLGTRTDNGIDAHYNGKYDNTDMAQKPVVSYINGLIEKEHDSIRAAVRYLLDTYPYAAPSGVRYALRNNAICYDRAWKFV